MRVVSLIARIDGGWSDRGSGIGVVVTDEFSGKRTRICRALGKECKTSNHAEAFALLTFLRFAIQRNASRVLVYSDSQLVVHNATRIRKCPDDLKPILQRCAQLIYRLGLTKFRIKHIRRGLNGEADALANKALPSRKGHNRQNSHNLHAQKQQKHRPRRK